MLGIRRGEVPDEDGLEKWHVESVLVADIDKGGPERWVEVGVRYRGGPRQSVTICAARSAVPAAGQLGHCPASAVSGAGAYGDGTEAVVRTSLVAQDSDADRDGRRRRLRAEGPESRGQGACKQALRKGTLRFHFACSE